MEDLYYIYHEECGDYYDFVCALFNHIRDTKNNDFYYGYLTISEIKYIDTSDIICFKIGCLYTNSEFTVYICKPINTFVTNEVNLNLTKKGYYKKGKLIEISIELVRGVIDIISTSISNNFCNEQNFNISNFIKEMFLTTLHKSGFSFRTYGSYKTTFMLQEFTDSLINNLNLLNRIIETKTISDLKVQLYHYIDEAGYELNAYLRDIKSDRFISCVINISRKDKNTIYLELNDISKIININDFIFLNKYEFIECISSLVNQATKEYKIIGLSPKDGNYKFKLIEEQYDNFSNVMNDVENYFYEVTQEQNIGIIKGKKFKTKDEFKICDNIDYVTKVYIHDNLIVFSTLYPYSKKLTMYTTGKENKYVFDIDGIKTLMFKSDFEFYIIYTLKDGLIRIPRTAILNLCESKLKEWFNIA